jgi:hypothetical protein
MQSQLEMIVSQIDGQKDMDRHGTGKQKESR